MQNSVRWFPPILSYALASSLAACGSAPDGSSGTDSLSVTAASSSSSGSSASTGAGGAAPSGAGSGGSGGAAPGSPADEAFRMLTGRFDTSEQAQADKAYYAIQLQTCVVDAPELGSRVLYVEQAMMAKLGAPYRQRLYVIDAAESSNGAVASRVYELAAPKAAVGLCANPGAKTFLAADALPREGCTVTLGWDAMATAFTGGTTGKECASSLNGAAYATSEVTLNASGLESWDRGFDAGGQQVWGAVKGPYRFARRTPIGE